MHFVLSTAFSLLVIPCPSCKLCIARWSAKWRVGRMGATSCDGDGSCGGGDVEEAHQMRTSLACWIACCWIAVSYLLSLQRSVLLLRAASRGVQRPLGRLRKTPTATNTGKKEARLKTQTVGSQRRFLKLFLLEVAGGLLTH